MAAVLGSLCLHAALLSVPLGLQGGEGFLPQAPNRTLHATLRVLPVVSTESVPAQLPQEPLPEATAAPADDAPKAEPPAGALPVSTAYFKASQLTEIPRPLTEPPLGDLERMVASTGTIRMTLFIDERGRVTAIDVTSATLPQEIAARAAAIFSHVPFSPGRIGRFAVKSQIGVTVGAAAKRSYGN